MTVIKTRLFKPPVKDGYLIRSQLLEKFIKNQYKPVILVIAPAGYGKSVVVSQWLDKIKTNYSWISLDKDCNELNQFLKLFCTAIIPYINKDDDLWEFLIETQQLPNLESIANHIVNSINDIQDEHILVLDDYHHIDNPDVHFLMQKLVDNISQKKIITFISRFDLPLNLRKLKSYDQVNEIRIVDLKFSLEEIRKLSSSVFLNPLYGDIPSIILKSTDGWIVPTRLILKNIAQNKLNPKTLKNKIGDKLEQTYGFLEYTLSQSDVEVQESMMIVSLFKRFSVSLLSEIIIILYPEKKQESELYKNKINQFIAQSLFIIPLDNNKTWYRFHDLIRDFLNKRIYSNFSPDKINIILITGTEFFEKEQYFEEAILLGIKGGNIPLSISIVEKNRSNFINQQQFDVLESWINLFPSDVTENYPVLLLTRAIVSERKREYINMTLDLERAKTLMPQLNEQKETSRVQWGEYYSIKSSIDFLEGHFDIALTNAEKAMQLLNHESTYFYYFTMSFRVFALNALGKTAEAFDLLVQDKNKHKANHEYIHIENSFINTMLLMINGHLNQYNHEAKLVHNIAFEKSYKALYVMASYYLKAKCLYANNDLKGYRKCKIEMDEFVQKFNEPNYLNLLAMIQVELALLEGDAQKRLVKFKNLDFKIKDITHLYFKPFLTEVKILLSKDEKQYIDQAETLIKQYSEKARLTYNRILILQVNCLNILLLIKQNNTEKALEHLRKSLSDTKEDGLIRLYTDCGYDMKKLFDQLTTHEKNDVYANKILQSFVHAPWNERFTNEINSSKKRELLLNNDEPYKVNISIREIKLITLLNKELHNKEIADLLNITTDSVKKSLYRLYKKLNVNNRSEAVKKATDMNLLKVHPKN